MYGMPASLMHRYDLPRPGRPFCNHCELLHAFLCRNVRALCLESSRYLGHGAYCFACQVSYYRSWYCSNRLLCTGLFCSPCPHPSGCRRLCIQVMPSWNCIKLDQNFCCSDPRARCVVNSYAPNVCFAPEMHSQEMAVYGKVWFPPLNDQGA
jgi:hypothetical protein